MMQHKLDIGKAWDDVVSMLRPAREILIPVAGLFFFVPFLAGLFLASQIDFGDGTNSEKVNQAMAEFFTANFHWLILITLVIQFGQLIITTYFIDQSRPSLSDAINKAVRYFLSAFGVFLIITLLTTFDQFLPLGESLSAFFLQLLFIIFGLFVSIRLGLSIPSLAAENITNPLKALARSWALTRGNFWSFFVLSLLFGLVAFMASLIFLLFVGGGLSLILPSGAATPVVLALAALCLAIISTVGMVIYVAVYKQLASSELQQKSS
jgi:hypothetical protein